MATRLTTQFDDPGRRDLLVATPTCCSCCCLVSTATMATLTVVHVHDAATAAGAPRPRRVKLTVAAAAAAPLGFGLAVGAPMAVGSLARPTSGGPWQMWQVVPTAFAALLALAAWVAALAWLYRLVDHANPLRPAGVFVGVTLLALAAEFFTAGFLVYGQLAALLVPVSAGVWFNRRLRERRSQPQRGGRHPRQMGVGCRGYAVSEMLRTPRTPYPGRP